MKESPPVIPLDDYESLSREERLRRVCALLAKAVTLACIREQAANGDAAPIPAGAKPGPEATAQAEKMEDLESTDFELFRQIHRWGEISPREATQLWSVSRATAHRRLSRLECAGWIVKRGATKATRYLLTQRANSLLMQMQQIKQAHEAPQGGQ